MNFDFFEHFLNKSLRESLQINPEDTPLIMTETAIHNKEHRLKLTEYLFEKLKVPAMFICKSPVLSTFACGRQTGVVIESGHKYTCTTPVHDGYTLQKCILRQEIGGQNVTDELRQFLSKQGTEVIPRFGFKKKITSNGG